MWYVTGVSFLYSSSKAAAAAAGSQKRLYEALFVIHPDVNCIQTYPVAQNCIKCRICCVRLRDVVALSVCIPDQ